MEYCISVKAIIWAVGCVIGGFPLIAICDWAHAKGRVAEIAMGVLMYAYGQVALFIGGWIGIESLSFSHDFWVKVFAG